MKHSSDVILGKRQKKKEDNSDCRMTSSSTQIQANMCKQAYARSILNVTIFISNKKNEKL